MKRISDFFILRYGFYIATLLLTVLLFLVDGCTNPENRYENDSVWSLPSFKKEQGIVLSLTDTSRFFCPIRQQPVRWLEKNVAVSSVMVRRNLVYLFYSGMDDQGISRIGISISGDGIHFSKVNQPLLFPAEDFMKEHEKGGIANPRIVENENGTFILNYTAYDGKTSRLCIATSGDLLNWTKEGPAFSGNYFSMPASSGSMVARREENQIIAQKINDKYWMYFNNDSLFVATSYNLIQWEPSKDNEGKVIKSSTVNHLESGPFALSTPQGVVLPYKREGLTTQLLFDPEDPTKIIDRFEDNLSIVGDADAKTLAGLVSFKNSWFLYYPISESQFGIAISSQTNSVVPAPNQ